MPSKEKLMIDLYPKTAETALDIASIPKNFKSFIKEVYEKGCTHKFNKKEDQNIYFKADLDQRLPFNNKQKVFFYKIQMLQK